MQLTSFEYGLFFLASFVVSWSFVSSKFLRLLTLLISSYAFIAIIDPLLAGLVFATATTTYSSGILIGSAPHNLLRRLAACTAIVAHIALFCAFKYYGFFMHALSPLLAEIGLDRDLIWLEFALPIGISFMMLQALSYLVDVYRGDMKAEKAFIDFHVLLSFFPKLVAGPLVKSGDFLGQLKLQAALTRKMVVTGVMLILIGLMKKLIIADMLATTLVDPVFTDPVRYSSLDVLCATYALAIQLYLDISGYCDLAIGSALLLGIKIGNNFDRPYSARSLTQFWQRWYTSLTSFFVDYVFRPLGGAKGSKLTAVANLLVTFLIAGLWHGAALTFTAFAFYHVFFIMSEYMLLKLKPAPIALGVGSGTGGFAQLVETSEKGHKLMGPVISTVLTFHIVCLGWVLFRSPDLESVMQIFSALTKGDISPELITPYLLFLMLVAFACHFLPKDLWKHISRHLCRMHVAVLSVLFGLSILVLQVMSSPHVKPFFYAGF